MSGLSGIGIVHTLISLVALVGGALALYQNGAITTRSRAGLVYTVATLLSCLTALMIFRRGAFGPPHAIAVLTIALLAIAWQAERARWFGRAAELVATLAFTTTFFFHFLAGTIETSTRVPSGAPLASGPDDPRLQAVLGVVLVLFLAGGVLQVRKLRSTRASAATS